MDFSKYLNHEENCSCGQKHYFSCDNITIAHGALNEVPSLIIKGRFINICLIQDDNTKIAAGDELLIIIKNVLKDNECYLNSITLPAKGLLADEQGIGSIITYIQPQCDLIIAIGSGTINDLCRFISFKLNIPYFIIATAPSMDGFTSNVAPMITKKTKTTYYAQIPKAVIADLDVLSKAPLTLIAAGVGDVLGKYTCLTDWWLAFLLTDEYYCPRVAELVRESIEKVREAAKELAREVTPSAIASLMEALVLSGIAMSYVGNSRPASGSEHQLAHYWEMQFLKNDEHGALHGTMVGVGTIIVLELFSMLKDYQPNFAILNQYQFAEEEWMRNIEKAYGSSSEVILNLETECKKNSTESVHKRLKRLEENWVKIINAVNALPTVDEAKKLLADLGAPIAPDEIRVNKEMLMNGIMYAKDLRNRYGLLQILYDLQVDVEKVI